VALPSALAIDVGLAMIKFETTPATSPEIAASAALAYRSFTSLFAVRSTS
jgi:hypothetical protein